MINVDDLKIVLEEMKAMETRLNTKIDDMKKGQDEQKLILTALEERTKVHGAEIKSIKNKLIKIDAKIDTVEGKLTNEIAEINIKIDNVEEKLTNEIAEINIKIDNVEEKLTNEIVEINIKIDNVEEKFETKFEKLNDKVDKIDDSTDDMKDDLNFLKQIEGRNFADIAELKAIK